MAIYTGETFAPTSQQAENLPNLGADAHQHPFTYLYSGNSWECVDLEAMGVPEDDRTSRYEWVPVLKKFHHRPGVNGYNGKPGSLGRALGEKQAQGWQVIPPEAAPNGVHYVQTLRTAHGTKYADVFTEFVKIGVRGWTSRGKKLEYLQWRRQLVRDGVITPPPIEVFQFGADRLRNSIQRMASSAHLPHIAKLIEERQALLEAMRTQRVTAADANDVKPKRRRGGKA